MKKTKQAYVGTGLRSTGVSACSSTVRLGQDRLGDGI